MQHLAGVYKCRKGRKRLWQLPRRGPPVAVRALQELDEALAAAAKVLVVELWRI